MELGCAYSSARQKAHLRIEVVLNITEFSENPPTLAQPGRVEVPGHVTGTDGGSFRLSQKAGHGETREGGQRHINGISTVVMSALSLGLVDE